MTTYFYTLIFEPSNWYTLCSQRWNTSAFSVPYYLIIYRVVNTSKLFRSDVSNCLQRIGKDIGFSWREILVYPHKQHSTENNATVNWVMPLWILVTEVTFLSWSSHSKYVNFCIYQFTPINILKRISMVSVRVSRIWRYYSRISSQLPARIILMVCMTVFNKTKTRSSSNMRGEFLKQLD